MILNGQVYYDPSHHPSWCLCEECELTHPGKREFWAAMENTSELATVTEDDE